VHSNWRVACVRIPRFPIGAVWQHAIVEEKRSIPRTGASPAPEPLHQNQNGTPNPNASAPPFPGNGVSPKRTPGRMDSSSAKEERKPNKENNEKKARGQRPHRQATGHGPQATGDDSLFTIHDSPVSHESHWDDLPIALSDGLRVRAVTAAGARAQIRAGMAVTEAQSRCADLEVFPWDQVVIDEEIRRATAAFLGASPQVTPVAGSPGMWWIGASGLETLGSEPSLAQTLLTLARRWHPEARVAIADSCVAARAGTWEPERPQATGHRPQTGPRPQAPGTIVPPGTDRAYLASAPIGLISMDEPMAEALAALGIRTAGALAALPPDDIEQRWGAAGLLSWRLARGEDRRRPGLATTEYPRTVSADLVPSVELMEPVLFLVRAGLDRLVNGLVTDGRAAATLAITLTLDDARGASAIAPAHTITREVRLAHPMARLVPLFERCRALLDRWPLPAPVCGVSVAVVATAPLAGEQGDLLDPSWHDPAAADAAFARLRAELGSEAIVVPIVADEHRPERAGAWVSLGDTDRPQATGRTERPQATGRTERPQATGHRPQMKSEVGGQRIAPRHAPGPRPQALIHDSPVPSCTRLLENPEPVDVECTDGQPRVLWWRGRRMRIEHPTGPERLAGDWWKDHYARDYWRCQDPDGDGTLLLYHDHSQACLSSGSAWFVQGWYD
jgi:protein ImuB